MNYGWGNIQPNQPPNGYYPPGNPAYPTAPGISAPGFGVSSGSGDGGMGVAIGSAYGAPQSYFGAPQPSFGASQPPFGAPQPYFSASQPPFGAPQPSFGAPQHTFGSQAPMPGPANTDVSSIGFNNLFNNLAQTRTPLPAPQHPAPPTPSVPLMPSAPPMQDNESLETVPMDRQSMPVEAGHRVNIIVAPSRYKDRDSTDKSSTHFLHPNLSNSDAKPSRPENSPSRRSPSPRLNVDGNSSERPNDARFQKGLKDMSTLMTDVNINDDVIKTLKSKFDLRESR